MTLEAVQRRRVDGRVGGGQTLLCDGGWKGAGRGGGHNDDDQGTDAQEHSDTKGVFSSCG